MEPGRLFYKYKDAIRESLDNFAFTERWHWTPEQIRNIDDTDIMVYKMILVGVNQEEAREQKKMNANNTSTRRR